MKIIQSAVSILLFFPVLLAFSQTPGTVTQSEWAVYLARGTGLEGKLPGPETPDKYIRAFSQDGFIRIEGEDYKTAGGEMTVSGDRKFGLPSQDKWVRAEDGSGKVTYRLVIPLEREYTLRARIRGERQLWQVDEKQPLLVEPEDNLEWKEVGKFTLEPGKHTVSVSLPQGGGMDVLELITSAAPPIAPAGGFVPLAPLSYGDKAETMIRALGWENMLPVDCGCSGFWEAENYGRAEGQVQIKEDNNYGEPSRKKWVLSPSEAVTLSYQINVPRDGLYTIRGRFWGGADNILSIEIDQNKVTFKPKARDKFGWIDINTAPLKEGQHQIDLTLSPGTGADVLQWLKKRSEPEDYLILLSEQGFAEDIPAPEAGSTAGRRYSPLIKVEGEAAGKVRGGHEISDSREYGAPSEKKWLSPRTEKLTSWFEIEIPGPEDDLSGDRRESALIEKEGEAADAIKGDFEISDSVEYGEPSASRWLFSPSGRIRCRFEVETPETEEEEEERPAPLWLKTEAEKSTRISGSYELSDSDQPGDPSEKKWVSSAAGASCRFEIDVPRDNLFVIYSRDFGGEPFTWTVDPDEELPLFRKKVMPADKNEFKWHKIANLYLPRGKHIVEVALGKKSGFDAWEMRKRKYCYENLFTVYSRDFGVKPFTWTIDPDEELPLFRKKVMPGEKNRFDWHEIATLYLPPGKHIFEVEIDQDSGLDQWEIRRKGWGDEGLYAIYSRDFGSEPITWTIDPEEDQPLLQQKVFPLEAEEFKWQEVSTLYLPRGKHLVEVEMGPGSGLDVWEIRKRGWTDCGLEELIDLPVDLRGALRNVSRLPGKKIPEEPGKPPVPDEPEEPENPEGSRYLP